MTASGQSNRPVTFDLQHRDPDSHARVGVVHTPHGSFDTPAFMPVGTQATIKGILPHLVSELGAQIILGNTYHLMLRPGSNRIQQLGGLHRFMNWNGPILTDSGGFQVFSLADINTINDDGVIFKSHLNGDTIHLTPERSMQVQNELGSDIMMAFDDCPPPPPAGASVDKKDSGESDSGETESRTGLSSEYIRRLDVANERTLRWLDRCFKAHARPEEQALFPIVQGGTDLGRRSWCAERITQFDACGYAIGGVAVGEGTEEIKKVVQHTAPLLPDDRPRYLMGVGYERDIVTAVKAGVDMFDCVLPTRNGRNANAFTQTGQIRLRNAKFKDDTRPIQEGCDCLACSGGPNGEPFTRAYLHHLFRADEMLGPILTTIHNLRHFQRLTFAIRQAIRDNTWLALERDWPIAFADPTA